MTPGTPVPDSPAPDSVRSRATTALKSILKDAFYRGSLILLVNTVSLAGFGFAFWALAAHMYTAAAVGTLSSITSGTGLLAEIASLGLPNTITRNIADAPNARQLVNVAVVATTLFGGLLCLATVVLAGPHLPAELHLGLRGGTSLLVTGFVVFTATGGLLQAGLVATRASQTVAITNLIGSIAKVATLFLLARLGSSGLLIAYGLGIALTSLLSLFTLLRRLRHGDSHVRPVRLLQEHLSMTAGNYGAMIMGILPSSVVPIEVLIVLGPADTARFTVAFMIAGFLNYIPSTVAQILFAEASRRGVYLSGQLRKALRGTYGLLLPPLVILVIGAPFVLRIFGAAYAAAGTGCLRVLALSSILTGGTYLIDSMLIARDRVAAYTFMNGANAALVLTGVGLLLPHGLTAAAEGWAAAQGISLLLGAAVVATGSAGKHRRPALDTTGPVVESPAVENHVWEISAGERRIAGPRRLSNAFEPQIRDLLVSWPMMPTTLIAERIGWNRPVSQLLNRVTELRMSHLSAGYPQFETRHPPGEVAQCGLWFPPAEIPTGHGQVRRAPQLPVLTMINGYSHWMSALLIPSRRAPDLFAGWWQLLAGLGALPKVLTWDSERVVGRRDANGRTELTPESRQFGAMLDTNIVIGGTAEPMTRGLVERAHTYLERSFLAGRAFSSPADFNAQLTAWLTVANSRSSFAMGQSPHGLVLADQRAMRPLPSAPPPTGWHKSAQLGPHPFISFDSNKYSVHPGAVGHRVDVTVDLQHLTVRCDGWIAAHHERSWGTGQTISNPAHVTLAPDRVPAGAQRLRPRTSASSSRPYHDIRGELSQREVPDEPFI